MANIASKSLCGKMRLFLKRKLLSVLLPHEDTRVIFRQCIPQLNVVGNFLRFQPSVCMSLQTKIVSIDDPSIQKYLTEILQGTEAERRHDNVDQINQLLKQREQVLADMKAVIELKEGVKDDKELKTIAEEEFVSYQRGLEDLDDKILRSLVPRHIHENYSDIVVEISSGAGGQEAMLFANELLQLYENYASLRGWSFIIDSIDKSELGGLKCVSIMIHGDGTFNYMQNEIGVHRVQRVPVTSSGGMIHTSTAAVIVMPQPTEIDIEINDKDLEIETTRANGPGGQNVNKSESAVRIKHIPTGIVVECQRERKQHQNRQIALMKLRTKLFDIENQKQSNVVNAIRRLQLGNRERSAKIRTYNFPQNRVTDHRAQITTHNIKEFMEGGNVFQIFHEKLREQNENQNIKQFVSNIKETYAS